MSTERVEVIRGLGMGGAEALLYQRLTVGGADSDQEVTIVNVAPERVDYQELLQAQDVPIVSTRTSKALGSAIDLLRLHAVRETREPIIVHSPYPALILKIARYLGAVHAPIVQVIHSANYKGMYGSAVLKVLNRAAAGCICVSDAAAQSSAAAGFRKSRTVYGGINTERMVDRIGSDWSQLPSYRIPDGHVMICSVGSLLKPKGHSDLIRAIAETPQHVHLTIVGDGPERKNLLDLIRDLGLEGRVELVGRKRDAWQWMVRADALCHSSWAEGLPVVLMEALSLGLPIIATDFAGAREAARICPDRLTIVPLRNIAGLTKALLEVSPRVARKEVVLSSLRSSYWSVRRYAKEFDAAVRWISS